MSQCWGVLGWWGTWYCYSYYHGEYDIKLHTVCEEVNVPMLGSGGEHGTATATIMVSMISSYTLCVRKPNVPMLGSAGVVGNMVLLLLLSW